ncbi:MAG TPA: CPBP family intramembrane metalloprotease [Petrotogaceae bacterium]|nr:CPBP family intramembrane metalloprotease [Petrotogaceae bacterium]HQI78310.1 CPBP family intramembrane metalloprotease [Petrotogaceae bacterium]
MSLFYGLIIIAISFVYQGVLSINPSVKEFFHGENSFIKSLTTFNIENLSLFDFEGRNTFFNILLSWLFFPMIVIYEEVLFRGVFLEFLNKKYKINTVLSIIIVSALFSFMHMSNSIYGLTHFFITGILFCIVYIKEKNLLYSMLTHLIINIFVLLLHIIGPTNITF